MDSSEKIDLHAEPASHSRRNAARWLVICIGGLPALATLLAFGGVWYWQLDMLSHFRVQYAVLLAIMVVLAMSMRQWRLALLVMVPLTINVAVILPLYLYPPWLVPHGEFVRQQPNPGTPLTIMSFNMDDMSGDNDEPLEMIRNSDADLIVLQGVNEKMLEQLSYSVAPFRVYLGDGRNDGYGLAVLVRVTIRPQVKIEDAKLIHLIEQSNPKTPAAIETHINWQGRKVVVLTLRAASPLVRYPRATQERQFQGIVAWSKRQHKPIILIGDLNTTPWSYAFSQLLQNANLVNSQSGFGVQGSWPATGGAISQIPVDHCLLSPSFITINRKLGPSFRSSHHALTVTLQWASGAKDRPPTVTHYDDDDGTEPQKPSGHHDYRRHASPRRPVEATTQPDKQD